MLTTCIYAGEKWLIKAKTFCGKALFKTELLVACSSWIVEPNSSSRRTHGFAVHWWGRKPMSVLLLFLAWYHIFMQRTTDPTEKACCGRRCLTPLEG